VSGLLICTLVARPPEFGHESHNGTRHEQDDGHDEALEITQGDLVTQLFKPILQRGPLIGRNRNIKTTPSF